jgi:hypothetical protein
VTEEILEELPLKALVSMIYEDEIERLNKKVKQLENDLKEMAYYYWRFVGVGDDSTEEAYGLMFEHKFVDEEGFWIGEE